MPLVQRDFVASEQKFLVMQHFLETKLCLSVELTVRQAHVDGLERTALLLVISIEVDQDHQLQIRAMEEEVYLGD